MVAAQMCRDMTETLKAASPIINTKKKHSNTDLDVDYHDNDRSIQVSPDERALKLLSWYISQ